LIATLFAILCPALAAPPARIVSTAPSLTEILYAVGAGSQVAGVTTYCRYPADALNKPKVGTFLQPDYERILALKPDLVLVIKNPIGVTAKLRSLGLRAEEFDVDTVQGVLAATVRIGALSGHAEPAARIRADIEAELASIRKSMAGQPRRRALFLVGRSPGTLQGMVGAGPGTFIEELMLLAGGENVLSAAPIQYPRVSLEQVLAADPDFILDMGDFAHASGKPGQPEAEIVALWARYPQLRAVRLKQVRVIDSETLIRPGPRMVEAARRFQQIFQSAGKPPAGARP
jgi:iron complex transport system substrate-binding protein